MEKFFSPTSIAIFGASKEPGKIGNEILKSLLYAKCKIYPVNPKYDEILNVKCYRSVDDLPDNIDLGIIVLSAKVVPNVIEQCGKKNISCIIIVSGGFKELGNENLEQQVVNNAKKYGIRIIGPNCIGVFNGVNLFDTFFQPKDKMLRPEKGPVSIVTQSGTYGCTLLEWFAQENIGVSKFVSFGNKCDIDEIDVLKYFLKDVDTKVIGMYLESVSNGRKLLDLLKISIKPIVILKSGITEQGSVIAKSHTGALACNHNVFSGAVEQFNGILVDDVELCFDTIKILALQTFPIGNRVAMLTNGVGPCVVATDIMAQSDALQLAQLSEQSQKILRENLSEYCVISNPLDLTGSATSEEYKFAIDVLEKDNNVDIILPFFVFQDVPLIATIEKLHHYFKTKSFTKPIVCCAGGGNYTNEQVKILQKLCIPVIPSPKRLILALEKIVRHAKNANYK